MSNYNEYLNEKSEVFKFIRDNNLEDKVICADLEARNRARIEGKQFLHSYRYSFIYDYVREKNIEPVKVSSKTLEIVSLLENPYDKDISELLRDGYELDNAMEI